MNSKRQAQVTLGLIVGAILIGIAIAQSSASTGEMAVASSDPSLKNTNQETMAVSGDFSGLVELNWVLTGVYSNTLATPTPAPGGTTGTGHIGDLDLSLRLDQVGTSVSGYVLLERSLVFPHEHTVTVDDKELAIGPRVSGTYDGDTLRLESERFSVLLSPEQRLADGQFIPERRATRQFSLISTSLEDEGAKLVGEYRETLWGFDIKPSTAIGGFTMNRPVFAISGLTPPVPTATLDPTQPTAVPTGQPTDTPPFTPVDHLYVPRVLRGTQ